MSVPSISIIGAGNIGSAVAGLAVKAGVSTQVVVRDASKATDLSGVDVAEIGSPLTGDIVVLALPYAAIDEVIATYGAQAFAGKVVVDPTNPLDFTTLDSLVPAGSSASAELAAKLPDAQVVKAFNTVFAAVLASGTIGAARALSWPPPTPQRPRRACAPSSRPPDWRGPTPASSSGQSVWRHSGH